MPEKAEKKETESLDVEQLIKDRHDLIVFLTEIKVLSGPQSELYRKIENFLNKFKV